jgi:hypothetical protein
MSFDVTLLFKHAFSGYYNKNTIPYFSHSIVYEVQNIVI